ncbi:MAG: general secretion pathway protein M [Bermanella sp.]|jgi:general secretion pathway protein M
MDWRTIDWKLTQRTESERKTVFIGAAAGIPLIIWLAIWQPLLSWRTDAEQRFDSRQQTLEWMQSAATTIRAHRQSGRPSTSAVSGSPEQMITRAAAVLGLAISRIEPSGEQRFNVFFAEADYQQFLQFVDQLQKQGLIIESLTMGQLPKPGQVSIRMTLESAL